MSERPDLNKELDGETFRSFYYPPLQAYLQYKKSLSNIIHLSPRQIRIGNI